jgi:IclR family mhp operon transcriptional activator
MTSQGPKRIQSLQRSISVIEFLARHGEASLAELRAGTGLSNSTLLRILATLQDHKWVRRLLAEGRYELPFSFGNILVNSSRGLPLTEVASQHLIDLQKKIGWPSDIAVPLANGKMEILETTRIKGPLAPNRTAYGVRPSIVQSALGRAYLAHCAPDARTRLLDHIEEHGDKQDRLWITNGTITTILEQTRAQGYGERERGYWAEPVDFGPDVNAIAVPVMDKNGYAIASISLIWIRDVVPVEDLVKTHLSALRKAADQIGQSYSAVIGD